MKRMVVVILIILFGFVGLAYGQSAKDAIEALQKLSSRCAMGISPRDYSPAMGETNFQVKAYLESPESSKNPKLKECIRKTWVYFLSAKAIMDYQSNMAGISVSRGWITPGIGASGELDKKLVAELISLYPEISGKLSKDGSLTYDDAVGMAWSYAAKELSFASRLLSLQPENKQPVNPPAATESMESKLDQIDQLKAKGKITDAEYKRMRKDILSEATKSK